VWNIEPTSERSRIIAAPAFDQAYARYDADERAVLANWNWTHFPPAPGDD
jgi:hypothetical protein